MSSFNVELEKKILNSLSNNFGLENYDEFRFGKCFDLQEPPISLIYQVKKIVKFIIGYKGKINILQIDWLSGYLNGLQHIYDNLNEEGKSLIVELMAYRHLGHKKVRLKRNNKEFNNGIAMGNSLADYHDVYDPHFMHFTLQKLNLNPIGYDINLYFTGAGVSTDFILEQYAYKSEGRTMVEVEKGDVVLDAGACWGDTALYFAHKTGEKGKVYSFEFIPNNIVLFNKNRLLNPHLLNSIELVEHPISNRKGDKIYYKDNGPGSRIEFEPFKEQTGFTTTITIDSFVKENNIAHVDFIKMDIEGAEPSALEGAIETIKKYRPKLAIAIYHSMDDFVNIPNWILNLNLGYEIFIDHFTIHAEETICFAKPRN